MRPTTPGYKDGVETGNFLTEELYLGRLTDPLSLNRYNYVKSSAPNYVDPSGYYTNVQGTDAHETLFAYLEKYGGGEVYGWDSGRTSFTAGIEDKISCWDDGRLYIEGED